MPELPEVETTVRGLDRILPGLTITGAWSDYRSSFHAGKDNIKNPDFFEKFRREVVGRKVTHASRRAKNVLIHLAGGKTILIHMKMTGHLLYGSYRKVTPKKRVPVSNKKSAIKSAFKKTDPRGWEHETWVPIADARGDEPTKLRDPFNRFIHFVLTLSEDSRRTQLAFSDMRKFAKITLIPTAALDQSTDLADIGPEPLTTSFSLARFKERLAKRPNGLIKQVLMDQQIIAGIGNIYSDEILWYACVHPRSRTGNIPPARLRSLYGEMKRILRRSIKLGGDSMSDFRNLAGEKGGFHPYHAAYMQHGKHCTRKSCVANPRAIMVKVKIGQRSAHFCPVHQKLF